MSDYKIEYTRLFISYIILDRYLTDFINLFYSDNRFTSIEIEELRYQTRHIRDFIDFIPNEYVPLNPSLNEILHIKHAYQEIFSNYRSIIKTNFNFSMYLENNKFYILNKL